jgi:outer membrane murein-binding lipoprotein Lpp
MKHGILISAVCISSLLLFGCADKKKIADLEATNQSLQAEIQNQIQAGAADKAKVQELEQANQVLQAEIQKLHLQAMNVKEASGAKSKKNVPAKSKGKAGSTAR